MGATIQPHPAYRRQTREILQGFNALDNEDRLVVLWVLSTYAKKDGSDTWQMIREQFTRLQEAETGAAADLAIAGLRAIYRNYSDR